LEALKQTGGYAGNPDLGMRDCGKRLPALLVTKTVDHGRTRDGVERERLHVAAGGQSRPQAMNRLRAGGV
jgi:hypothetical protein